MTILSLADAKAHLRVDHDDDDGLIAAYIAAAVDHVERYTGLVLEPRQVAQGFDRFGFRMTLDAWPIRSATAIVTYVDAGGVEQIIPAAAIARTTRPARLPASSGVQAVVSYGDPIVVTVEAGYEAGAVPAGIVQALKLLVGHYYRNREAVVVGANAAEAPMAVDALLRPHRLALV